jgi:hypothetical protein
MFPFSVFFLVFSCWSGAEIDLFSGKVAGEETTSVDFLSALPHVIDAI